MTVLKAWAIPFSDLANQSFAKLDHTYVTAHHDAAQNSPPIQAWGCSGRSSGGRPIGVFPGCDIELARAIAGPDGDAGIKFGLTGISHQAANRILWCGGGLVRGAAGYNASEFLWGTYGRDAEDFRKLIADSVQRHSSEASPDHSSFEDRKTPTLPEFLPNSPEVQEPLEGTLYVAGEPPPQLIKVKDAISVELINYLKSHPEELDKLKPRQFERLVAEVLSSFQFDVELTPATKDGGFDLYAIRKEISGVDHHFIVECKKYRRDRKVGVSFVRELYGVSSQLGIPALLATTSQFTSEALKLQASHYNLQLKDIKGIIDWINNYHAKPDGKLYYRSGRIIIPKPR